MRSAKPRDGQVFTRRWVVEALLDLAGYTTDRPLESMRLVEPSVGDGAFLGPILQRLLTRALGRGVQLEALADCLRGYDLDQSKVESSRTECVDALLLAGADEDLAHQLATRWIAQADYLLDEADWPADVVIGNPPYIRYDDLDSDVVAQYAQRWSTFAGRGDIYIGFWERALRSLKPGGVVAFICADRWMRNTYGARLRELVGAEFSMRAVWSMHEVDAFESRVSAYPAITVIAREQQGAVAMLDTTAAFGERSARAAAAWTVGKRKSGAGDGWTGYRLANWYRGRGLWPAGDPTRLALLDELAYLPTIEQTGVTVGIGIASGADRDYIVPAATAPVEPERLLPLATAGSLRSSGKVEWSGECLVNPWEVDGKLVDLAAYPRLRAYYESSPRIARRHVAAKNPDRWYRTIDKVIPGLAETPKILIPDMRPALTPYLDYGGLYPHHNLYWITSKIWDLEVLGGLLLSDIASTFVEAYCTRMRGGTLRLMAQYLRTIRVPRPDTIDPSTAARLRAAFQAYDREDASEAARVAYRLSPTVAAA